VEVSPLLGPAPLEVVVSEGQKQAIPGDSIVIDWGDGSETPLTVTTTCTNFLGYLTSVVDLDKNPVFHTYEAPGTYVAKYRECSEAGCLEQDIDWGNPEKATVVVEEPVDPPPPDDCNSTELQRISTQESTSREATTQAAIPSCPIPLTITAKPTDKSCVNQAVTFTETGADTASWSGGGKPATGTGKSFTTQFATIGSHTVTAKATDGAKGIKTWKVLQPSGSSWTNQFPTGSSTADLSSPFRANAESFISALRQAGATVSISATYRPLERAYMMHYSWLIEKKQINPANVPAKNGVDICWLHRNADGTPNIASSRTAATQMVTAFGLDRKSQYAPALESRHTARAAVDMNISWSGTLKIRDASGNLVKIATTPRTGAGNRELRAVGATYGVYKLPKDPPHWSDNGH
jgi:hypothetical protein